MKIRKKQIIKLHVFVCVGEEFGSGTLMFLPSTYKAWVGRFSCRCGTALKVFLCRLRTKPCGLGSPKRTNKLAGGQEQIPAPQKSAFEGQCPSRVLSALGKGWDWLGHVRHRMILARFCYPWRARLYHYYTCVVVVHSCLCQALIRHEWGASLADVGLHSKSSHVAWEQNRAGLAPQSGQTSLRVIMKKILPHNN